MKEKYIKKILEANRLAMQCRKLNEWGATKTLQVYATAYDDFSEIIGNLSSMIYCIELISSLERCLNKYKGKGDGEIDRESLEGEIDYNEELANNYFEKLKSFVEKRNEEQWS